VLTLVVKKIFWGGRSETERIVHLLRSFYGKRFLIVNRRGFCVAIGFAHYRRKCNQRRVISAWGKSGNESLTLK